MEPFLLLILDGLGLNPSTRGNAVAAAKTPNLDRLLKEYPSTKLITHGKRVGLPEGQMGNSEVGHLNIGAGRIVHQDLSRINSALEEGSILAAKAGQEILANAKDGSLHLLGLLSSGGVHSEASHLIGIVESALKTGLKKIYIHAITDGRDRPPQAAITEILKTEEAITQLAKLYGAEVRIVDLIGRYFAMDRDKRWERTEKAWQLFVEGKGESSTSLKEAIELQYSKNISDEFIEPVKLPNHKPITAGDCLLLFNFRADRMRQLTEAFLLNENFSHFSEDTLALRPKFLASLTEYDQNFKLPVIFPPLKVANHLGEVLEANGKKQLRLAETEKYPHVTYFFSGGVEESLQGENRAMVPSPKEVATYDLKPEMSVKGVTKKLLEALRSGTTDVAIVNFANCDMVGHTGVFEAAVAAVEAVDTCLGEVLHCLDQVSGSALITADHGNAEQMVNYDTGEPHTFHTTFPVPIALYNNENCNYSLRDGGALCDIAPTICDLLNISPPKQMTGNSLLIR